MPPSLKLSRNSCRPLDDIAVRLPRGAALRVLDGDGVTYHEGGSPFCASGALGTHTILALNSEGRLVGTGSFRVEASTEIRDKKGEFGPLLKNLALTMEQSCNADGARQATVDGKTYRFYICWLRDHTHTLKGMQYFEAAPKSAVELFADTQRADGMIYDLIHPKNELQGWRDHVFAKGHFIRTLGSDGPRQYSLQRIPVENDVEYLFIECLYRTWRSTGDTAWMSRYLENAIRAVAYATTDPYRWSSKFKLPKRGYTIDTWDFMHGDDARVSGGENLVDNEKTSFGIMHGDVTGLAASCRHLATMLRASDRKNEAPAFERLADQLMKRLDTLSWNGRFYRHHVSENPNFKRNVGPVDETAQITLSNAYALDRGIGEDKCRAIIQSYRKLKREMPKASPGEWYTCYPPFEKGFNPHAPMWQYMNGGVTTIVAGELARGAFAHGDPEYGVDILRRIGKLADRHGGHLHVCFNGNPQTRPPKRKMTVVDLARQSNISAVWKTSGGWGDKNNDLGGLPVGRHTFMGVPFKLSGNGIGIGNTGAGFAREVIVPIQAEFASAYLLHTARGAGMVGEFEVRYGDGTSLVQPIQTGGQVGNWFMPPKGPATASCCPPGTPAGWPAYQLAWNGANASFKSVGVFLWGWNNPNPAKTVSALVFRSTCANAQWWIPSVTLSDAPVWFPQSDLSYGIPDAWGAAAVVTALLEGLVGVRDDDIAMRKTTLAPQWELCGESEAEATVKYEASGGYVSYRWRKKGNLITLKIAHSGDSATVHLPMPGFRGKQTVVVDGTAIDPVVVDGTLIVELSGRRAHEISVDVRGDSPGAQSQSQS